MYIIIIIITATTTVTTGFTFSVEPHMVVFKVELLDLFRHFVLRALHLGEAAGVRDLLVQFPAPVVAQKLVQLGDLTHRVLEHKVNVNDKTEWKSTEKNRNTLASP